MQVLAIHHTTKAKDSSHRLNNPQSLAVADHLNRCGIRGPTHHTATLPQCSSSKWCNTCHIPTS
jgi:hypothetical protein